MKFSFGEIPGKYAFPANSIKNILIRLFLHAKFIFAIKKESKNLCFFEKNTEKKKKYLLQLFCIYGDFSQQSRGEFSKTPEIKFL